MNVSSNPKNELWCAMRASEYNPHQRVEWTTSFLLWRLECLDPTIRGNWLFGNVEQRRERIREKIISRGARSIRTVLKKSRHEGYVYRDDVYTILEALVDDPIGLFIKGLSDPDREIRWSCDKWLRDKGSGESRAIKPLIDYLRKHPYEGSVSETLEFIGVDATEPIVELIIDSRASFHARLRACFYFTHRTDRINPIMAEKLLKFIVDPSQDERLRSELNAILKQNPSEPSAEANS